MGGSRFGRWSVSADGTPAFHVSDEGARSGGWHLVGAPGLLATVDARGLTSLWATSRGMVRPVDRGGRWSIDGIAPTITSTCFEPDGVTWTASVTGAGPVRRRLRADADHARLHLEIENMGTTPVDVEERWEVHPRPLVIGSLMSRPIPPPSTFGPLRRARWRAVFAVSGTVRALTDCGRSAIAATMRPTVGADGASLRVTARRASAPGDIRPRWVDRRWGELAMRRVDPGPHDTWSTTGVRLRLAPGASATLVLELDVSGAPAVPPSPPTADRLDAAAGAPGSEILEIAPPELAAEARWHLAQLRGLRVPDAAFGRTFTMQGSAYAFVHGVHGAPRDVAIVAVALAPFDPEMARELVRFLARTCRPSGAMHYLHTGSGRTTSAAVHAAPTDLPLWLLWAVAEVVAATGDDGLLDEVHPFAPGDPAPATTVGERLVAAARWMRTAVGTGAHGMLRVGSGDWSDPISLMVRRRRAFHRWGESGFNTAFAAHALPLAAPLIAMVDPDEADRARALADRCAAAMDAAWTGRWYLRGWDGCGAPVGRDHLFLDGQVWTLIAGIGQEDRRRSLVEEIRRRCDDPSPIGPTILDRPHRVRGDLLAPGWDCNGGVWAAISALTAWGYATVDADLAWRCLERQSMAAHGRAHPDRWAGTWSGPDCRNSHLGDEAGGTFVHPATPMAEFPVMNSNFHAGPLLALAKVVATDRERGESRVS